MGIANKALSYRRMICHGSNVPISNTRLCSSLLPGARDRPSPSRFVGIRVTLGLSFAPDRSDLGQDRP